MSTLKRENVARELLNRIPEFALVRSKDSAYMSHDSEESYLIFGDFGHFLVSLLTRSTGEPEVKDTIINSFSFLSEVATSADKEVANLAVIGVFETLADSSDCVRAARQYLDVPALHIFNRTVRGWTAV